MRWRAEGNSNLAFLEQLEFQSNRWRLQYLEAFPE